MQKAARLARLINTRPPHTKEIPGKFTLWVVHYLNFIENIRIAFQWLPLMKIKKWLNNFCAHEILVCYITKDAQKKKTTLLFWNSRNNILLFWHSVGLLWIKPCLQVNFPHLPTKSYFIWDEWPWHKYDLNCWDLGNKKTHDRTIIVLRNLDLIKQAA